MLYGGERCQLADVLRRGEVPAFAGMTEQSVVWNVGTENCVDDDEVNKPILTYEENIFVSAFARNAGGGVLRM